MKSIGNGLKRIFLKIIFSLLLSVIHCMVVVYYWGKRKTLPPIKNPLLFKSATQLAEDIRKGKIKSVEVVQAFVDRAREVHPYVNAVAEECFDDALEKARKADALIHSGVFTEQQLAEDKPLLGIPFTVKVLLMVKGLKNTAASLIFKDRTATEDAAAVALMKKAGGIVMATTNSAEFGLTLETDNYLYGKTSNPYDTTKTAGGSSGGEGALISSGGSVIGLGNDVLGSIRIPAHYCGLFGHKATLGMVSNAGASPEAHPSMLFMLYSGPMCRYSEDLVTMMKVLTSENEKKFTPLQSVNFKELKIYYQTQVDHVLVNTPDEDIIQAIRNAVSHFTETHGTVAKEVKIPLINKMHSISLSLLHGRIPSVWETVTNKKLSGIYEFLKYLIGIPTYSFTTIICAWLGKSPFIFSKEQIPHHIELNQKLEEEFDNLLDENSIFLFPTMPITAPYHIESRFLLPLSIYPSVFNCIGFPSTQCPMGLSRKGMPLGIQIAGRKNNDALTIACAAELEKAFGGWIPPESVRKTNEHT